MRSATEQSRAELSARIYRGSRFALHARSRPITPDNAAERASRSTDQRPLCVKVYPLAKLAGGPTRR